MDKDRSKILLSDRRHVWRPYTSAEDHADRDPIVVKRAEGVWLEDFNGKRYLDGNASWWTNNLGHGHPRIRKVLAQQSETLLHCSLADITHEHAAYLAEELIQIAPGNQSARHRASKNALSRVFYSDDGSTAVEVAVKVAFQYCQQNNMPQRRTFLCFGGGFHGETLGAMSVSGIEEFHGVYGPLLFDRIQAPNVASAEDEAAELAGWEEATHFLERTLEQKGGEIAAVIVEPRVQGATGMRIWPAALLKRVADATRAAGAFLIADEVFVGLGRTGSMWACEQANVVPDLLCSAKSLSGGALPFAATIATEKIYDGFRGGKGRALMHGHTFCGNPLGAAVAREVLAVYRDESVLEQVEKRAKILAQAFQELGELDGVFKARTLGMVAAFELGKRGYLGTMGWRVFEEAKKRGAYIRPLGNTVYLTPSLNIPEEDLKALLDILRESVTHVVSEA